METVVESNFPYESFREKQFETLDVCFNALEEGYKNIVIDAPVGSGKSGLCTTLLRYSDGGFYTTPQRSLREQIQTDEKLDPYVEDLKARSDYYCSVTGTNCKDCSVYNDQEQSCAEQNSPPCNYWRRKQNVMNSPIALITFSMLIVDGLLPVHSGEMQISFDDRDMVVVDEAHGLVEQTREMHAGFDITPYGLPNTVFSGVTESVSWDANRYEDVQSEITTILQRCMDYVRDVPPVEMTDAENRCFRLAENIKRANEDIQNDRAWVVNVEGKQYKGNYVKTLELRPIDISNFLNNFVWSRGDKRVISTATLRHRDNPDVWLRKVGLDPKKTKVVSVGMTFPVENRPIITNEIVGSLSGDDEDKNWDAVMEKLNKIAKKHAGKKGICHTSSYSRAKDVRDSVNDKYQYLQDNLFIHEREADPSVAIDEWQSSDKDMILSPSMMEGVDLKGNKGRYNILLKVPYPQRNSWTEYLLEETGYGWAEYFDRTANRIAQAYGRTNRSKDDWSNFYIFDEDYYDIKKRAKLPEWFLEAEEYPEVGVNSLFDY